MTPYFYIYWAKDVQEYHIHCTYEANLLGDKYFACFTRMFDAYRYVQRENNPNVPRPYPL